MTTPLDGSLHTHQTLSYDSDVSLVETQEYIESCSEDSDSQEENNSVISSDEVRKDDVQPISNSPHSWSEEGTQEADNLINSSKGEELHSLVYIPDEPLAPKIVVSMTSSYQGMQYIRKTLLSLTDQGFNKIYLNVPGSYFSYSHHLVPEWMSFICQVNFCSGGFSPLLSLVPTLQRELDGNTIIITVENGYIYPKGMAKEFLQVFKKYPDYVYASSVYKFKSVNYFQQVTINGNVGDCFEGARGVGYLRKFFRPDFESYLSMVVGFEACRFSEYLIIMNYLQRYKISVKSLIRKNYNVNLVMAQLRKDELYTSSGLSYKVVFKYYQVIQFLVHHNLLHLRNPNSVVECLRYLVTRPYNVPFGV